jgi:hypothetical protein
VTVDAGLLAISSRLYARHDLVLLVPAAIVGIAYATAATTSDAELLRIVLGVVVAVLAVASGWISAPAQLRARVLKLRPTAAR